MQVLEDEVVEELEASVTEIYQKIFSPFLLLDFFFLFLKAFGRPNLLSGN